MASHYAAVRLDVVHSDDGSRLKTWLQSESVIEYVFYEENGDQTGKLHYQGYIKSGDESSFKKLKDSFKKWFSAHSRFQRSFTHPRKVENYMIYVSKDKNMLCSLGVSEEVIAEREAKSYKKGADRDKRPVVVRGVEKFASGNQRYSSSFNRIVATWVIDDCISRGVGFDEFTTSRWANAIVCALSENSKDRMIERLLSRM